MQKTMKHLVMKTLRRLGYKLIKVKKNPIERRAVALNSAQVTDLEELAQRSSFIPGMVSPESGKFLYALCYMQEIQGDVVEIGSWQGFSTSFLAKAVRDSKNGSLYAIDHFKGVPDMQKYFAVDSEDLTDLKNNFLENMNTIGLREDITLFDMVNDEAAGQLRDKKIRFLFIDGDHSKSGVEKDIHLFFPMLVPGAIVVFDDFNSVQAGLVSAIDELLASRKVRRIFSYKNTLVVMFD